jgi:uncharacterized repeat protein (TIGR02543 family)
MPYFPEGEQNMSQSVIEKFKNISKQIFATFSAATLVAVSVFGLSSSASATEMAPIIEFDGNILNSSVVHSEIGERPVQGVSTLNPAPLSRVMTTNRSGYSFGGWSYAQGGPAVTTLETATHTTTRMWLYAVWNTKLNLDPNGGTGASSIDYRFASTLTLPTSSSATKKGYAFAGWTSAPGSNILVTTYRAAGDAVGNPTVYAAWKKTVSFASKGSTGAVPSPMTHFEGGARFALPSSEQVGLTRSGFKFMGWSTTPKGKVVKNPTAYLPKKANVTLYAVWNKK